MGEIEVFTPLVSVLITAYNREDFIKEAIESVQSNDYPNWELIIVDDNSRDQTIEIAKKYSSENDRIRIYKNEKNIGDYPNRNLAASFARGKYIVYVDSDDWMIYDGLSKWVAEMEKFGAAFGIFAHSEFKEPVLLSAEKIIRYHFFNNPLLSFGPGATIITREYFNRIGGFPEMYGPANDMYYNLKAASNTDTLVLNTPMNNYRVHANQELNNKYSYLYNNFRYLRDVLAEIKLPLTKSEKRFLEKKNKRRFLTNTFRYYITTHDWKKTRNAYRMADFRFRDIIVAVFQR